MYIHGTYQSGQWTCRPDRVVLIVGSGVGTAGGGGTAGAGGKSISLVAVTSIVTESSMCGGFKLSSDITSSLLFTSTVNFFGSMFDDLVRTVVWLFQRSTYCMLSYKDMGTSEIAAHERSLLHVMIGWSSS